MTSDELLVWGAEGIAGGFMGGVGSLAFSKFMEANTSRAVPLATLFEEQLAKIGKAIGKAIKDNELVKLRASTNALSTSMLHYKNAPSDDRLEFATHDAVGLVSQTMGLDACAFQTFLMAANLHLTVLAERHTRFDQPGELLNIKQSLGKYIYHCKAMRAKCKEKILRCMGSGKPRELGGTGRWHWIYCVNKSDIERGLLPLGVKKDEIKSRYKDRMNTAPGPGMSNRFMYDGGVYSLDKWWIVNFSLNAMDLSAHDSNVAGNALEDKIYKLYQGDHDWMRRIFDAETQAEAIQGSWEKKLSDM